MLTGSDFNSDRHAMFAALVLVLTFVASAGCVARQETQRETSRGELPDVAKAILSRPHSVELLSLYPELLDQTHGDDFHDWQVLGRAALDEAAAKRIVEGLQAGLAAPDVPALCFNPRHGLIVTAGDDMVELVICFECAQIEVYYEDQRLPTVATSRKPNALFDEIARANKLTMPPPK